MTEEQKEYLREVVNAIVELMRKLEPGTKVTGSHRYHGLDITLTIEKAKS